MQKREKIRCLVVDDEPLAREILKQYISGVESLELAGTCSNALEAMSFLQESSVDLLFLDIQMPQLLGTHFIRTLKNAPKVIFTTAYRKYAVEGFELDAVDYILKPVSFERFLKGVNKVIQLTTHPEPVIVTQKETIPTTNSFLYFRVDKKMVRVLYRDILYIEALKDYIRIVTPSKIMITRYVLTTLEELLPSSEFIRIHKSYIVAIHKIDSYNADCIQIGHHELPIGRLYKFEVTRILNSVSASPQ
jgi:DNA-binding LytR/AlgR family response regulator